MKRRASTRNWSTRTKSCSARGRRPKLCCVKPKKRAAGVREGADRYAADVLAEMEGRLAGALGAVRKGREVLEKPRHIADQPLADAAAKSKRAAFDMQAAAEETAALESV